MAKILIAEDDDYARKLLKIILEKAECDYTVVEADSGTAALTSVEAEIPDLILLDVMMPGMDGFSVCKRLKDDPKYKSIPIIFCTALDNPADKLQGFEAGGEDYVTKPVNEEEVLARVGAHLRIIEAEEERVNSLLSTMKDMITVNNQSIDLSLKEALNKLDFLSVESEGNEALSKAVNDVKSELNKINDVLKNVQAQTDKVSNLKRIDYIYSASMFDTGSSEAA